MYNHTLYIMIFNKLCELNWKDYVHVMILTSNQISCDFEYFKIYLI
jgi:hypothetical protein